MGRTRRKQLAADAVREILAHWHDPSTASYVEDFIHADRGEWDSRWGGYRTTKNGDPKPVNAIGDFEGKARDFDGSSDSLSVADDSDLDTGSDEDMALVALVERGATSSAETIVQKWDGSIGYRLRMQSDGTVDFIVDDGTNADTASSNTAIDDGATHLVTASVDRGGSQITIEVDGTRENTTALSAGDLSNTSDLVIADGEFSGDAQVAARHGVWLSEPQAGYLDALLRGDLARGALARLRSVVYGHHETGLQRRLPSYLTDAFGAGGPDFWWSADRHIHAVDGEGVVQLTDHGGTDFVSQRDSSQQGMARGPSARGEPLDYLEFTGSEVYSYVPSITIDKFTQAFIARRTEDSTDFQAVDYWNTSGSGNVQLSFQNHDDILCRAKDDSAGVTSNLTLDGIADGNWVAAVHTVDFSAGTHRLVAENENGTRAEDSASSVGWTSGHTPDQRAIGSSSLDSGSFVGGIAESFNRQAHLSNADQDALLDALAKKLP